MDDQRAWSREVEFGRDRGISFRLGECAVCGMWPHGDLRLGRALALPSRIRASEAARQRASAGLCRAHERTEPGTVHAADWRLCQGRTDRAQAVAPAPFSAPLHRGRRGVAVLGRRGARAAQRPGHTAHPQARIRGLRQARVRAVGPAFQRPPLQPAPEPPLRPAPLRKDPAHRGSDRRTQKARAQRPARFSAHRHRAPGRRPRGARESITSTPSTSLRSGRWCWQHPVFQRLG